METLTQPRRLLALLALAVLAAGCTRTRETRWDAVQTQKTPAVAKEAIEGSEFNKFFPKAESPWDLVYKQEKKGTAIASLKKEGKEVATLTVFDTVSNPEAIAEYKESTQALAGWPLVAKGAKGTAILVNRRLQVQVRSAEDALDEDGRKEWLKKFDLDGLAKLE